MKYQKTNFAKEEGFIEDVEAARNKGAMSQDSEVVDAFKERTNELFHPIDDLSADEIEAIVYLHVEGIIDTYGLDAEVVGVALSGSRCRGLEQSGSDLDVVVEVKGNEREDSLFDILNEDALILNGVRVDINPITAYKSGTLETYLPQVEQYLSEKAAQMGQKKHGRVSVKEKLEEKRTVAIGFAGNTKEFDKWQGMGK